MSSDGKVSTGKWEYIPGANSLLIDRVKDKILLNQEFFEDGLVILKYDGFSDRYFILANENIIPDLDIEKYIKNIFYSKNHIVKIEATNDEIYEIAKNSPKAPAGMLGQAIFQNLNEIDDCIIQSKKSNIIYYIKNSVISKKSSILIFYTSEKQKLFIECFFTSKAPDYQFNYGDIVRLGGKRDDIAPDGVYKIKQFGTIRVKDGIIVPLS